MADNQKVPAVSRPSPLSASSSLALDQWRGLALLLVLISHGLYFTGRTEGIGRVGVNIFFFISGILVFRSLDRVSELPAAIICKDFWWRRLKRLYPALLGYVLAMIPITYLLQNREGISFNQDLPTYVHRLWVPLIFMVNFLTKHIPESLYHLWSVSCEMQFYLIAPILFLLGGRSKGQRMLVWSIALLALLGGGVAAPIMLKKFPENTPEQAMKYQFQFAVWPMMLGFFVEANNGILRLFPRKTGQVIVWLGLLLLACATGLMFAGILSKLAVVGVGALMIVPCYVAYSSNVQIPGPVGKGLAWIGERTYSIYLWQQPLTISNYLPDIWQPVGAAVSILVGAIWFNLLERPFMKGRPKANAPSA